MRYGDDRTYTAWVAEQPVNCRGETKCEGGISSTRTVCDTQCGGTATPWMSVDVC
ncbi:MAG: hypothetical protein HOY69_05370 [Streptomyces sp.]|nr:hypothetical protein [Streptomyces sp.]